MTGRPGRKPWNHRGPEPATCDCANRRTEHGNSHMYQKHRCGCVDCKEHNRREQGRRRLTKERGNRLMVPAAPVRAHLEVLLDAGWTLNALSRACGVPLETIRAVRSNEQVHARTARGILAVSPAQAVKTPRMSALGTVRRLRALAARGWTNVELGARTGYGQTGITHLTNGNRERISLDLHERVCEVYEELWNATPPPGGSTLRAQRRAAAKGWLPPMALDDDRLDDPTYVPDVTPMEGRQHTRAAEIAELAELGYDTQDIAHRLGLTRHAVTSSVRRDPAAAERLARNDRAAEFGRWSA